VHLYKFTDGRLKITLHYDSKTEDFNIDIGQKLQGLITDFGGEIITENITSIASIHPSVIKNVLIQKLLTKSGQAALIEKLSIYKKYIGDVLNDDVDGYRNKSDKEIKGENITDIASIINYLFGIGSTPLKNRTLHTLIFLTSLPSAILLEFQSLLGLFEEIATQIQNNELVQE
jgi:hypothetical protein